MGLNQDAGEGYKLHHHLKIGGKFCINFAENHHFLRRAPHDSPVTETANYTVFGKDVNDKVIMEDSDLYCNGSALVALRLN